MIFLSIINHNHDHLIVSNTSLAQIAENNPVIIKSNTPASAALKDFAGSHKITLLDSDHGLGFGENNNFVFKYLVNNKIISDDDYFLVINPDVIIEPNELEKLKDAIAGYESEIFTINLFYDEKFEKPELSIRRFPKLTGPLKGLLKKDYRSDAYDKKTICEPLQIDWAAGSFLLFKKKSYERLEGFSNKFFMYFEDVDICRRAKKMKMPLTYLPGIKAIHKGAFNNRKIYSKHFRWFLISYLTYHFFS
ncbi:glycosyltransferase family 2 protein [Enterobacter sp. RHBSTW-00994]|uniref:glycosyltransferase family 2 protein n=1 Tax=Enterobacter sp. RHBSTW-00994 TaxID=2742676 RepID=UPI0015E96A41|nr:glycosyltransferase family 2 protein [Enterobacter sp. RHBSTW-00994]QLR43840.1 glycosyltransferase family 2 protein [Enterobacter sp. RHBSTW-00994]